jgi:hypothetical protein
VSDRSEFIVGSFFEAVPDGADALVLKSVIHDWDDEQSCKILENCRRALPISGKLLLIERLIPVIPEANPDHCSIALSDLNMLALGASACDRTEGEFHELLGNSCFRMTRVKPAGRYNVIETTVTQNLRRLLRPKDEPPGTYGQKARNFRIADTPAPGVGKTTKYDYVRMKLSGGRIVEATVKAIVDSADELDCRFHLEMRRRRFICARLLKRPSTSHRWHPKPLQAPLQQRRRAPSTTA